MRPLGPFDESDFAFERNDPRLRKQLDTGRVILMSVGNQDRDDGVRSELTPCQLGEDRFSGGVVSGINERDLPAWPPAPELYRALCTPVFQAPAGRYAWLNESVFVGEIRYESEDGVSVDIYRLL